jgi:acyl-CoA synthetase (AMP-forming)/AMP-acid ligase II
MAIHIHDQERDRTAVVQGNRFATYGSLSDRARLIASIIRKMRQRRIILVLDNSIESIELLYGAMSSGKDVVVMPEFIPQKARKFIAASVRTSKFIGVGTGTLDPTSNNYNLTVLSAPMSDPVPGRPILFTSGNTGRPKLVMLTSEVMLNDFGYERAALGITADRRCYMPGPVATTMAPQALVFRSGATLVIDNQLQTPEHINHMMSYHNCDMLMTIPSTVKKITDSNTKIDRLQTLISATSAFPVELKRRWLDLHPGTDLYDIYASTEAGVIGIATGASDVFDVVPAASVMTDDDGLLKVYSPYTAKGVFRRGLLRKTGGFISFGDHGVYLNKSIHALSRESSKVKVSGFAVYTRHIEDVARSFPGVVNAHATVTRGSPDDIIDLNIDGDVDEIEVKEFLKDNLPWWAIPRKVVVA